MVVAFAAGWTIGSRHSDSTDWTDAAVTVTGTQASVVVDGTTYEVGQTLPGWLDDGTWKQNSWPTCLTDGFSGTLPVLVSSTSASGSTIKAVVAVDCGHP